MFIKSLELKNFRCFEDIKIEFNPEYSVIVGVNGSGKSTILDWMRLPRRWEAI